MSIKESSKQSVGQQDASDAGFYDYPRTFRTALPQIIAVSVKNLLLIGYGMTLGFPTILIPAVQKPNEEGGLQLETAEISWIASINLIMVPLGCALSGVVTTPIGRRSAMQLVNLPFFVAWLLFHFATSTAQLYAALVLTGLAGGLLEAPVLTYVAEITQPHLRGALTATSSMCIIIGVFTQFLMGLLAPWRTIALINISVTLLAVVALFAVPESPHWLVTRNRIEEAGKSLQWLRGWIGPVAVEKELKDIQAMYSYESRVNTGHSWCSRVGLTESLAEILLHYRKKTFLVPFALVCYAFFVGHFSGMTTLQMLEAPIDKYYATLVLGILQIAGSGACVALVRYTGKRPLALASTAGAGLCCCLVAGYDGFMRLEGLDFPTGFSENITEYVNETIYQNSTLLGNDTQPLTVTSEVDYEGLDFPTGFSENITEYVNETLYQNSTLLGNDTQPLTVTSEVDHQNPYAWMPTTFLMALAIISHTGIRLLPWILIGEVFSSETRSGAAGLASAVGYIFGFLTNKMYLSMVDVFAIWGTYGFYGIVGLSGAIVFYFVLPETEGKSLSDIEDHFAGRRRLSNRVRRVAHQTGGNGSYTPWSSITLSPIDNIAFELNESIFSNSTGTSLYDVRGQKALNGKALKTDKSPNYRETFA